MSERDSLGADIKSGAEELKHRAEAFGEKASRALEGDEMPLGDRIASHVKEAGHDIAADAHRAGRESRDEARKEETR